MPSPVDRVAVAAGYRAATAALAARAADDVGAWWDRTDGHDATFPVVAGLTVAVANRRAVTLADKYLSDVLTVTLGEPVLADPADPDAYADHDHLRRVLTGADRFTATRIAGNEPLDAGRAALRRGQDRHPQVVAAERTGGTCEICAPLNGTRVPVDADVSSHPHCDCTTIPIVSEENPND